MLELQTFGSVGLRSRAADESVAAPVQPKRLALLIYLALAPRRRFRRRDQVVSLLWPESDSEHARGALNQALRYLRRALGPEVVVSQGEEEVALDQNRLWCDAVAFRDHLEGADPTRALEVYRGAFLEGFFIEDVAPEFEEWVEAERSGFRARAAEAARACLLAAERKGDLAGALGWARKAVMVSPDDEPSTAQLVRVLAAHGDRAGALTTYEALRRRLQVQFGVTPSAETEAIVAAIRGR